jgi:hypothetical protein
LLASLPTDLQHDLTDQKGYQTQHPKKLSNIPGGPLLSNQTLFKNGTANGAAINRRIMPL